MLMDAEALLPEYAEELFKPHRFKSLYGGRGAGRSWSVARALLIITSTQRKRVLCCREIQRSVRESVWALLRDQIDLLGLRGFSVTDREIRHENGSLFLFAGLRHDVEKIKSLEGVDICWIEQGEAVVENSWLILLPTIRRPGSEIWVTWNVDMVDDATYRRLVLHPPPDCWSKRVGYRDNPWFPDVLRAEMEYLRRVDPDAAANVWDGEPRHSSAATVLHGKWVVENLDPGADWEGPYFGLDFGFAHDPFAVVECWIQGTVLHIQNEVYRLGLELDHIVPTLLQVWPALAGYVIRADSARPDSISYLRQHGLPKLVGVEKGPGSVEDGIAYLRQFERIVVHSRCKNWIDEARAYSYRVDPRSGDILPVLVDAANNLIDGTRYALAPMIRPRTKVISSAAAARARGAGVRPLLQEAS